MQISFINYIFMFFDIVIFLLVVIGVAGLSKHSETLKTLPWEEAIELEVFGLDLDAFLLGWDILTLFAYLLSILARIRLVRHISAGYVAKRHAILENNVHL
jgi:hypothetical protein